MMQRVLWMIMVLVTATAFAGDPPTVKLNAPDKFSRDHKIVLKIDGLEKTNARVKWWLRSDEGRANPDSEVSSDGQLCYVWAPLGKYEALITVGVPDSDTIHWIDVEHKFQVVDSGPVPPGPTPPTPPTPVPPAPSDFGDVVSEVIKYADPVRDDNKPEAAKLIAKAYRDNAALAAKGEYGTAEALADATSSQFVYDLGMSRYLRWRPSQTKLREHMTALSKDGKLKDMKDWARLWEEYAKGFDAVAAKGVINVEAKN